MHRLSKHSSDGFTLLEVLIAIAVFAVLSALAYGGLNSLLNTNEDTERHSASLSQLQNAMSVLSRDLEFAIGRSIRDEFGDTRPALAGSPNNDITLELTRLGWNNPARYRRSQMQRVAYWRNEDKLMRAHWRVLDRAQESEATEIVLLDQINDFQVRYLNGDRKWKEQWPPFGLGGASYTGPLLPKAIELWFDTVQFGEITRVFQLPQDAG